MGLKSSNYVASGFERICYNTYFLGQNIIYYLITTYLAVYYVKGLGISAVAVSTILFSARIYDAVIDPILATIIEKSSLKGGKFLPWLRFASFTVPIITVLCFSFSGVLNSMSMTTRIAYATVTYILWGTLYAAADAPANALASVMTPNSEERTQLYSWSKFTSIIGTILGLILFQFLLSALSPNAKNDVYEYFWPVLIFSVIAMITMILINVAKERVKAVQTEKPTIKEVLSGVLKNKYLLTLVTVNLISGATGFYVLLIPFIAADIYHNQDILMPIIAATTLPMLFVAPFMRTLINKVGKIRLYGMSMLISSIIAIVMYFTCRDSLTLTIIMSILYGVTLAPTTMMGSILFADTIDYYGHKSGKRFEAITFATSTFVNKFSTAFCSGIGMWAIGVAGYVSTTGKAVTQPASALNVLWAIALLGTGLGALVSAVIFIKFYTLDDKKLTEINAENSVNI
jgi:glycoside/pentoside/hexuronide:cation symporter, GPH family